MGMWQGLYQGYMDAQQERRLREEREDRLRMREEDVAFRREEMDLRRQQFQDQQEARRREMYLDLLPTWRQNSEQAQEIADYGSQILGIIQDESIVDLLLSSQNPEAIGRIARDLTAGHRSAVESGQGEEYIAMARDAFTNDYRIEAARRGEIDPEVLGDIVSPEELSRLGISTSYTIPGDIVGSPIVFQPVATPEQVNQTVESIQRNYSSAVYQDLQRIDEIMGVFTSRDTSGGLTDAERADMQLLEERRRLVESASQQADEGSLTGLLSLYGTAPAEAMLQDLPFSMNPARISSDFVNPPERAPFIFESRAQAARFGANAEEGGIYGILRPGDVFFIPNPSTGELERWEATGR